MRDDDDDFDNDEPDSDPPSGRMLYSGINSHPERADYALPIGLSALQDGDAEFELDPDEDGGDPVEASLPSRTRVAILSGVASLLLSIVFCTGFVLGWQPDPAVGAARGQLAASADLTARIDANLDEWARRVSSGALHELIAYRQPFLAVVRLQNPAATDELWKGVERLLRIALVAGPDEKVRMIRECLYVIDCEHVPAELYGIVWDLKSELRRLETK